jgi:hypothetical protein
MNDGRRPSQRGDAQVTVPPQRGGVLDSETLRRHTVSVQQCATREGLDRLTKLLWRTYSGNPANRKALHQLRVRIEAQRAILDRNDPR